MFNALSEHSYCQNTLNIALIFSSSFVIFSYTLGKAVLLLANNNNNKKVNMVLNILSSFSINNDGYNFVITESWEKTGIWLCF